MAGLAPPGRWDARTQFGTAAVYGRVETYANFDRSTPQATFPSPAEIPGTENENPTPLDSDGAALIFWADGLLYSIDVYDRNNNLIYSQDNYPTMATNSPSGPIVINLSILNLLLNPQLSNWNQGALSWVRSQMTPEPFQVADGWFFGGAAADSTVTISAGEFSLGQGEVPDNPVRYLNYTCTNVGSGGELDKFLFQPLDMEIYDPEGQPYPSINGVQALANQTVTVSFWARSPTNSILELRIDQFFGNGGSPSPIVETDFTPASLTTTWTKYTRTVLVPNINGKTLGTDGDDTTRFVFSYPINTIATVYITNVFLQKGSVSTPFPYRAPTQQLNDELLLLLGNFLVGTRIIGWSATQTLYEFLTQSVTPVGLINFGIFPVAPDGWLVMDDGTIGDSGSGATNRANADTEALYTLLWDNTSNSYCPVSGGRGTSASDDFDALKTIQLPRMQGRVPGGVGQGAGLSDRSLGQYLGEELHSLSEAELAPHFHQTGIDAAGITGEPGGSAYNLVDFVATDTTTVGLGDGHNTMQPTTFYNFIIKY